MSETPRATQAVIALQAAGETCANCNADLIGGEIYCCHCGEKLPAHNDLSLKKFLQHHFVHELTHLDGKIFQTLKRLFIKPGLVAEEYLAGRKGRYVGPLRMFLTTVIVLALTLSFQPSSQRATIRQSAARMDPSGLLSQMVAHKAKTVDLEAEIFKLNFDQKFKAYSGILSLVVVAIACLPLMLVYRHVRKYYAEHLILALYTVSALLLFDAVAIWLQMLIEKIFEPPRWGWPKQIELYMNFVMMGIFGVYVFTACKRFYRNSTGKALLALPLVFVTAMLASRLLSALGFGLALLLV